MEGVLGRRIAGSSVDLRFLCFEQENAWCFISGTVERCWERNRARSLFGSGLWKEMINMVFLDVTSWVYLLAGLYII